MKIACTFYPSILLWALGISQIQISLRALFFYLLSPRSFRPSSRSLSLSIEFQTIPYYIIILFSQNMPQSSRSTCFGHYIYCLIRSQHIHHVFCIFSVREFGTTHCSHHCSFCSSQDTHIFFSQTPRFTAIQHCRPDTTLMDFCFDL